jgi:Gnt-I system high-affinity gluconate transporter
MQFKASMVVTFGYGIIIAIPAIILAGPIFSSTLKKIPSTNTLSLVVEKKEEELPGTANSLISSLLPVLIIGVATVLSGFGEANSLLNQILNFLSEPNVAMSLTILIATYTLGIRTGKSLTQIMNVYGEAVKDIAMILLIIGSAGILKQIFVDSGVSAEIANVLSSLTLPPLLLAWLVTAVLRLALGSATIAGLTAAGIVYPLTLQNGVDPNLMVLSIGAGSLFCSHVNDTAFWLFKEYFGLSMKDTFRSWTVMETLVSIIGLIGVLILDQFV